MRGLLEFVMKDLISNQLIIAETFHDMQRAIDTDFANLRRERQDYAQKSVMALRQLWSIFDDNNHLLIEAQTKDDIYFTAKIYNKVKDEYCFIKPVLLEFQPALPKGCNSAKQHNTENTPENDLITQQRTHFNRLQNEIKSINIDRVQVQEEMENWQKTLKLRWDIIDRFDQAIGEEHSSRWPDATYKLEYVLYKNMYETTMSLFNYKLDALLNPAVRVIPHIGIPTWRMFDNYADVQPFAVNSVAWVNFDSLSDVIRKNKMSEGEKRQLLIRTFLTYQNHESSSPEDSDSERDDDNKDQEETTTVDCGKPVDSPQIYQVD